MKLKNVLMFVFLTLTLIPIIIVSVLLYKSGFDLSRESYIRNLEESINTQADYISQTMKNDMISDYRFVNSSQILSALESGENDNRVKGVVSSFQTYLDTSEDKISVCFLSDRNSVPLYTIGEKATIEAISNQLPDLSEIKKQTIVEFDLRNNIRSLGILTPVYIKDTYAGCLISVYNESYIFKIISNYYEITDTATYICRQSGEIIDFRGLTDYKERPDVQSLLIDSTFANEGTINQRVKNISVAGYYKNINGSPWYLVGFVDDKLIYSFTNQFILFYIVIIIGVCIADIILSFYFSRKIVEPINDLVEVMASYENNLDHTALIGKEKRSYYETHFLRKKFLDLMKSILLVQHNFEGVYQLYQSSDMGDINIDIDVIQQTISSNKETFQELMENVDFQKEDCIVQRFTRCFCEEDQVKLMNIFETMRDEHLAVTSESEIYMPHLGERWYHILVVPMYQDDRLSRLFIQLRDVSNFKKQEVQSIELARRDALTGLYNRAGFIEYVNRFLTRDISAIHALLFIDMNDFKMVNDNLGHNAGDALLCSVGNTLVATVGSRGLASRFGGDEFAVFLPDTSKEQAQELKDTLYQKLIFPFDTGIMKFEISSSVGISLWDSDHPEPLDELLKQADTSMYKTKRKLKEAALNQYK